MGLDGVNVNDKILLPIRLRLQLRGILGIPTSTSNSLPASEVGISMALMKTLCGRLRAKLGVIG